MRTRDLMKGSGLMLLAAASWGGLFPVAKATLAHVDAWFLTAIRYGSTAFIFLALLTLVEGRQALRPGARRFELWLFGSFGFAGFSLLVFAGLGSTSPEHGAVLMALMPMITALANWALKGARPAGFTLATIGAALLGVFLVVTRADPAATLAHGSVHGDLLILLGACCWVIYTLGAGRFAGWSPLRYSALSCAFGVTTIFAAAAIAVAIGAAHLPDAAALGAVWAELLYTVVFASVLAVLSWNAGIRALGALNGVLFVNVVPITAFAIGLALGHRFSGAEVLGSALTILALVANNLYLRRPRPAAPSLVQAARRAA
jgi:drug/metabolite transporter (DMT)-like permease